MAEPQTQASQPSRFGIDSGRPSHEGMIKSIESVFPQNRSEAFRQLGQLELTVAGSVFRNDLGRINADLRISGLLNGPTGDIEIVGDHGNFKLAHTDRRGNTDGTAVLTGQTSKFSDNNGSAIDQLFDMAGSGSSSKLNGKSIEVPPTVKAPAVDAPPAARELTPLPSPGRNRFHVDTTGDPLAPPKGWAPHIVHPSTRPTVQESAPVFSGDSLPAKLQSVKPVAGETRDTSTPAPLPGLGDLFSAPFNLSPNSAPKPEVPVYGKNKNIDRQPFSPFSNGPLPAADPAIGGKLKSGVPPETTQMPFPLDPIFKGLFPELNLPADLNGSVIKPAPEVKVPERPPEVPHLPSPVKDKPIAPPLGMVPGDWKTGDVDSSTVAVDHLSVFATGFTRNEGGPNDGHLRKNFTLQNYMAYQKRLANGENVPRDQQVPYISLAMDDQIGIQDGQLVRIPSLEKMFGMPLKFRVTDTGSAFTNRHFDKVDVNVDTKAQASDITTRRDVLFMKEPTSQEREADLQFAADHRVPTAPSRHRRQPAHHGRRHH